MTSSAHLRLPHRVLAGLATGRAAGLAAAVLACLFAGETAAQTLAAGPPPPQMAPEPPAPPPPEYASPDEARLRATLSKALEPVVEARLGPEAAVLLEGVLALPRPAFIAAAETAEAALGDTPAATLVRWRRLLWSQADAGQYRAFLKAHPNWPEEDDMRARFERALLDGNLPAAEIKRDLEAFPPVSGAGEMALAIALKALGETEKARQTVKRAWCRKRFPSENEDDILAALGDDLEPGDHKCRLDRLLVSNPRLKFIRTSRAAAAKRLVPLLAEDERAKARARIAVFEGGNALKDLIAIVRQPKLVAGDWGLAYQRAQRSRRNGDHAHAYKILAAVPGEHEDLVNRDEWWEERERHARYWLRQGNAQRAYELVADVRPREANPAKAQAFFAGWLALVHLKKPALARDHFTRMVAHADGPLSKSKSEYWLAKAHRALGKEADAMRHFTESATIRDTFHGLLARREIRPKTRAIELPPATPPDPATAERFANNEVVAALVAGMRHGLDRRSQLAFYRTLGQSLETEGELALLAQLASLLGDGQGEVRVGKSAVARGFNAYEFAYPVHHLPDYKPLREPVEPAMLLAIGRQESEFDTTIVSRAGARGVLQVMPITMRHVCRQYGLECQVDDLLTDASYNTRIASAYIADRRDEFGGSYILTLTGFNAGPGRTRQWLRQMGDPRRRDVAPLDWIYRIPFEETRLYVRKVLSNVQVYRARLGEKDPLRIDQDLARGRR